MEGITGGTKPVAPEHGLTAKLPPEPRLEETPAPDLKAFRDSEEKALTSYGWVDQKAGVVRIPIDRAIELTAQRGLPSRAEKDRPAASDTSVPTESGLGTKMQQVGGPLAGGPK
jgi:hypothetical protein